MRTSLSRKAASRAAIVVAFTGLLGLLAIPKEKDDVPDLKFKLRTELVLIPTVVTDKSGDHITGLKKEDFTVLENGTEEKITTFEEISSKPDRFSRPDVPNEFSNSVAGAPSSRRITLIVLDFLNTRFADQATAREELLKYLTQSVDMREPMALYTLDRAGMHVIHDFTTDPRILVAALHEVNGDPGQFVDRPNDSADNTGAGSPGGASQGGVGEHISKESVHKEASSIQGMMQEAAANFRSFEQRLAIEYTLEAMQQIAQALGGFPGRKSLIWASGGFPFTVSGSMGIAPAGRDTLADVLPLYERTWDLLNNAGISLYPVDVKGLRVVGLPSAARSGGSSMHNPSKGNSFSHATSRQMDTQSTFQTFASMTGGRAYSNSNDLVKGFRDAVRDSSEYYMLGYYLDHSNTKSGWRKLAVKVNRDHIEVRARTGFFVTDATIDPDSSRNGDIASALQSPLDYTSLALLAHWSKTEPASEPGKKRVMYQMRLSPDATIVNEADNNHVVLDFVAQAIAADGKPVGQPVGRKVDVHLTAEKLNVIRSQGVLYNVALELAPGEYTVRFVVRDDITGRTGSVSGPLKLE